MLILMELIFEVRDAEEGGFWARALGQSIFTQGETWDELRSNVLEVTNLHFEDSALRPELAQLHYVKDEIFPVQTA
jgi:predicted RNase H-like HicB family nuclease